MQTRARHFDLKLLALLVALQPLNTHAVSSFGRRPAQEPAASQTQSGPRRYLIKPLNIGATTDVHARSSRSLQVRVTDENDRPVPDLPLLFTLEAVGGPGNSGTLAGRLVPRGSPNAPGTTTAQATGAQTQTTATQASTTQANAAQAEAGTTAGTEAQAPSPSEARLESAESKAGKPQSSPSQAAQEPTPQTQTQPTQDPAADAARGDRPATAQEADKSTSAKSAGEDPTREASQSGAGEQPGAREKQKEDKDKEDDDDKGAVPPFLWLRARTNRQGIATVGLKAGDLAGPRVQVKVQVEDNDSVWQGLFSITPPSAIVGHIPKRSLTDRQWTTTDGQQISIGSLRGRVAVLHFFGSWCGYSKAQSRLFRPYTERGLPPELVILGLFVKDPRSNPELVRQYIADQGVTYPVVGPVEDKFFSQFVESRDVSVPQTVVLNREGRIVAHFNGYSEQINEEIKSLIEDVIYGGE
jgi:peroxiredoxin